MQRMQSPDHDQGCRDRGPGGTPTRCHQSCRRYLPHRKLSYSAWHSARFFTHNTGHLVPRIHVVHRDVSVLRGTPWLAIPQRNRMFLRIDSGSDGAGTGGGQRIIAPDQMPRLLISPSDTALMIPSTMRRFSLKSRCLRFSPLQSCTFQAKAFPVSAIRR